MVQKEEGTLVSFEIHGLDSNSLARAEVLRTGWHACAQDKPKRCSEEAIIGRAADYLARKKAKAERIAADQHEF